MSKIITQEETLEIQNLKKEVLKNPSILLTRVNGVSLFWDLCDRGKILDFFYPEEIPFVKNSDYFYRARIPLGEFGNFQEKRNAIFKNRTEEILILVCELIRQENIHEVMDYLKEILVIYDLNHSHSDLLYYLGYSDTFMILTSFLSENQIDNFINLKNFYLEEILGKNVLSINSLGKKNRKAIIEKFLEKDNLFFSDEIYLDFEELMDIAKKYPKILAFITENQINFDEIVISNELLDPDEFPEYKEKIHKYYGLLKNVAWDKKIFSGYTASNVRPLEKNKIFNFFNFDVRQKLMEELFTKLFSPRLNFFITLSDIFYCFDGIKDLPIFQNIDRFEKFRAGIEDFIIKDNNFNTRLLKNLQENKNKIIELLKLKILGKKSFISIMYSILDKLYINLVALLPCMDFIQNNSERVKKLINTCRKFISDGDFDFIISKEEKQRYESVIDSIDPEKLRDQDVIYTENYHNRWEIRSFYKLNKLFLVTSVARYRNVPSEFIIKNLNSDNPPEFLFTLDIYFSNFPNLTDFYRESVYNSEQTITIARADYSTDRLTDGFARSLKRLTYDDFKISLEERKMLIDEFFYFYTNNSAYSFKPELIESLKNVLNWID